MSEIQERCKLCNVVLNDENWYEGAKKLPFLRCKLCYSKRSKEYVNRPENRELIIKRSRERWWNLDNLSNFQDDNVKQEIDLIQETLF